MEKLLITKNEEELWTMAQTQNTARNQYGSGSAYISLSQ